MREIIFKAKRVDNGEWVIGYLTKSFYPSPYRAVWCIEEEKVTAIYKQGTEYTMQPYEVIPETVGQYTGLTDKNKKKIFEGDILLKGFDKVVVGWNDNQCRWSIYVNDCEIMGFNEYTKNYFEVIGNIHDNPELLKGE